MVCVSFRKEGQEFAQIVVSYGEQTQTYGDCSWLDFAFMPMSLRYHKPIKFVDDAEEWARSLVNAYIDSGIEVIVTERLDVTKPKRGFGFRRSSTSRN